MSEKVALLIGNTDGIGAKATKRLLKENFKVVGISKSSSLLTHPNYVHIVQDVSASEYRQRLTDSLASMPSLDLCIYFAGIGDQLHWDNLAFETKVFEVNLMAAVVTTEVVLDAMLKRGRGHFIGLSSVADAITSSEAPSYSASKSGISRFWEGLGLAMKNTNVRISNVRFGFVDTKMSKPPLRPFLMSTDSAVEFIFDVIKNPRIRATKPKLILPLVWVAGLPNRFRLLFR